MITYTYRYNKTGRMSSFSKKDKRLLRLLLDDNVKLHSFTTKTTGLITIDGDTKECHICCREIRRRSPQPKPKSYYALFYINMNSLEKQQKAKRYHSWCFRRTIMNIVKKQIHSTPLKDDKYRDVRSIVGKKLIAIYAKHLSLMISSGSKTPSSIPLDVINFCEK